MTRSGNQIELIGVAGVTHTATYITESLMRLTKIPVGIICRSYINFEQEGLL